MRRRLQLVGRLAETWVRRPPSPTRLVLDLTRRCNLRCEMCRTWQRAAAGELTSEEIGSTLAALPRLTWLDLTGGEPFVRADIDAVFEAVVRNTAALTVLHFQTNGWQTRRIESTTRRLRSMAKDVEIIVTVSIDGPPSLHDRIRGREGSCARARDTARALMGIPGIDVHIGTTIGSSNAHAIEPLHAWLRAELPGFTARRWHLNWLQRSEHFFGNASMDDPREVPPDSAILDHLRRRGLPRSLVELMEAVFLVNLDAHRRGEPAGVRCQALRSTAFLSPEGDVYPCHVYDRPLGNVRERSFAEIWDAAATRAARRDIEALACGGCFTACEAYPAMAGAPLRTAVLTARRLADMVTR
jgi:radical SAM protein with 4Fe4S-binding SPASM domain